MESDQYLQVRNNGAAMQINLVCIFRKKTENNGLPNALFMTNSEERMQKGIQAIASYPGNTISISEK
jgi:hypothetical protein